MMIGLSLLILTVVSAQLNPVEHGALLAVYNSLLCLYVLEDCPSFPAEQRCPTTPRNALECTASSVTRLTVEESFVSGTIATQIGLLTNLRILCVLLLSSVIDFLV
jgi:hypothetical protein